MKVDVVMPKMGESLQEGTIIKWLKNVGEKVERDEMILEISTDKVDTEVPSPVEGIISQILAAENETIEVGKVIAIIETDGEAAVSAPDEKQAVAETAAPAPPPAPVPDAQPEAASASVNGELVEVVMPKMGESLQEGTIVKWLKNKGEEVERDEMILEISTDKVDTEVPSPVSGILVEILAAENETVEVGNVIAKISTGEVAPVSASATAEKSSEVVVETPVEKSPAPQPVKTPVSTTKEIPRKVNGNFYSPLVRKIAEENRVTLEELQALTGTGIDGRVNKNDILNYIDNRGSAPAPDLPAVKAPTAITAVQPKVASVTSFGGDDEIIPMDRIRQLISDHMVFSKHTSAHVTSVGEADITGIVKLRKKIKDEFFAREGIKLTYTPFFAKATVDGIKANPMVNVSVDGTNIIKHNRINLGMATALPDNNLIVPVIKNADALSFTGLQRSVTDLAERARSRKLNPDDIQGGTFTITNYGTSGTLFGSPIINQPECAILGIGSIQKRPVARLIEGEYLIVIRDMVYISLTYDHRAIDGAYAGATLSSIIKSLESMNENTVTF